MSNQEVKIYSPGFESGKIFIPGPDYRSYRFTLLRTILNSKGWHCSTYDNYSNSHYSTLFVNIRKRDILLPIISPNPILCIYEPKMLRPLNHSALVNSLFNVVCGWDSLPEYYLGPGTYIPMNFSNYFFNTRRVRKSTLICSNKSCNTSSYELYSYRAAIIKHYLTNNNNLFNLYGYGWSATDFPLTAYNFNKIYKGSPYNKLLTLSRYTFCYAIENEISDSLYITEKILDAMIAGCIPIYLGSTIISKLIDPELFIDLRNFETLTDLDAFLASLSDSDIYLLKEKIYNFLLSNMHTSTLFCYKWSSKVAEICML